METLFFESEVSLEKPETFNLGDFEEKILVAKSNREPSDNVMVFLLLPQRGEERFYEKEIYGKKIAEWVKLAVSDYPVQELEINEENNPIEFILPYLTEHEITVVMYGDTPLLSKRVLDEMLAYFSARRMNVLKAKRGYVFDTRFLKENGRIESGDNKLFCGDEFFAVKDSQSFSVASNRIHKGIMAFYVENGVEILDRSTVFIDADAVIEKGVKIYPQNVICGSTYLGQNVILKSGNTIDNSEIQEGCVLAHCHIKNTTVKMFACHAFEKLEG